jgi:hypothetical protein
MLFKDTVYTQTGIFKGHTNGTCGEGVIRINMKHSMDMLFVSPLSLGVRCSHIAVLVGRYIYGKVWAFSIEYSRLFVMGHRSCGNMLVVIDSGISNN